MRWRHDVVRIYRYGDRCKLVYFKTGGGSPDSDRSGGGFAADSEDGDKERFDNNICRARARVRELALCNPWDCFVTLTLDGEKHDREDLAAFRQKLAQWVRNQRRLTGADIRYLFIPERHKAGGWHIHGLMAGLQESHLRAFQLSEHLPMAILKQLKAGNQIYEIPGLTRAFGWTTASKIRDADRTASYITKYISKDIKATASIMESGGHLFFASRGLAGKRLLYDGPLYEASEIPWAFENDYCKLVWLTGDDLNALHLDPIFKREGGQD